MYGEKIRAKLAPLTEKKKCYLAPKIRDVGVIAWTLEREHFLPLLETEEVYVDMSRAITSSYLSWLLILLKYSPSLCIHIILVYYRTCYSFHL